MKKSIALACLIIVVVNAFVTLQASGNFIAKEPLSDLFFYGKDDQALRDVAKKYSFYARVNEAAGQFLVFSSFLTDGLIGVIVVSCLVPRKRT